jgi:hypothetical protein
METSTQLGLGQQAHEGQHALACFPPPLRDALGRAAEAEKLLSDVFPRLAAEMEGEAVSSGASRESQSQLEGRAFLARLRMQHQLALEALHDWGGHRTSNESVAKAYDDFASLARAFARWATR